MCSSCSLHSPIFLQNLEALSAGGTSWNVDMICSELCTTTLPTECEGGGGGAFRSLSRLKIQRRTHTVFDDSCQFIMEISLNHSYNFVDKLRRFMTTEKLGKRCCGFYWLLLLLSGNSIINVLNKCHKRNGFGVKMYIKLEDYILRFVGLFITFLLQD